MGAGPSSESTGAGPRKTDVKVCGDKALSGLGERLGEVGGYRLHDYFADSESARHSLPTYSFHLILCITFIWLIS